ncbi:hypothetical protein R4282_22415 [Rhodococcus oxybenzonivorans]|jgi:hypothetical protein|uniref:hypothetical protein n=1 Tax=Rhodococcus TaxID=1827 RepID=UPI00135CB030|nr:MULTISPECIES: hypothetical protein [Rhodococcus]MDV7355750.1 hypothetical protein [Rhodococcus oxybenzonivorans]
MSECAFVAVWSMDPAKSAEQEAGLHETIVPLTKAQPGFIEGLWARDDTDAIACIVFDTEEHARAFMGLVQTDPGGRGPAGVSNRSMHVLPRLTRA